MGKNPKINMKTSKLRELIRETIKEGFREPEDWEITPDYYDAFLYFQDLAQKERRAFKGIDFAQFLDKHTDGIPDSLLGVLNKPIKEAEKEGNFDSRFKKAMGGAGFSDEEQEDIMSRDVGSPFPGPATDVGNGVILAQETIKNWRENLYKNMSDKELDSFSKEMIEHLLLRPAAQAAAKIFFGKKGL